MGRLIFYDERQPIHLLGDLLFQRLQSHSLSPVFDPGSPSALVIQDDGRICWPASLYLAFMAEASPSQSLETIRTYGECIVDWLKYVRRRKLPLDRATDEHLIAYRNNMRRRLLTPDTINLRTFAVARFYRWSARSLSWQSSIAFSDAAPERPRGDSSQWNPRLQIGTIRLSIPDNERLPRAVPRAQLVLLESALDETHALAMRWMLSTGIRRAELCNLNCEHVPDVSDLDPSTNRIMKLEIPRKGHPEADLFAPFHLLEATNWYCLTHYGRANRHQPVFCGPTGRRLNPDVLGSKIRAAAQPLGINATPHSFRHTFALVVLKLLQDAANRGADINPLKTLQILMGHASVETTEIYVRALEVQSDEVADALDYLYGENPTLTPGVAQWLAKF